MKFKAEQKVMYWDSGKHPLAREPHLNGRLAIVVAETNDNNVFIRWVSPEFHCPNSLYDYGVFSDNLWLVQEQMMLPFGAENV